MAKRIALICFLTLTLLWVAFIFSNSLDNGEESSDKSSAVTESVNDFMQSIGIEKPISEGSIRTLGHFSEFFVLGLLICADLLFAPQIKLTTACFQYFRFFLSVLLCFIIACVDEFIQRFSAGRAMQFSDALVDTFGALCAVAIFSLTYFLVVKIKKARL